MKTQKREQPVDLSSAQRNALLETLKTRFEKNMRRHDGLRWNQVQVRLEAQRKKLWSLHQMEQTVGDPDVVGSGNKSAEYIFVDCSLQSPGSRRSLCYDDEALDSRKTHKPKNSALGLAAAMGIEILTEEQYRQLQELGEFDTTTSSWIQTPAEIRKLGGALFCDRRFNHVFVYHNGAESYYAGRGFRGCLRV